MHEITTPNIMRKNIFFLFLILQSCFIGSQNISSGLYFASHTAIKEKRTSLEASPQFDAGNGFILDFDIKLRPELHNYGYIFRIIINKERSFDLIANFSPMKRSLNLIEGNNIYLTFQNEQLEDYLLNTWAHIQCHIQPNCVQISFNDQSLKENFTPITLKNVNFNFGYSVQPGFHASDVPPMSIRNIKITNEEGKTVAYWPLSKHSEFASLDSLHSIPATVTNPTWEINKHIKWNKIESFKLPIYTQICQVLTSDNKIFFSNSSFILWYSTTENKADTIYPIQGVPYIEKNNQTIYNPYYHELWSYDFDKHKNLSLFNFANQSWSNNDPEIKNPDYSQHNAFISSFDSCLYIFGGYGNYQYKNKILKKQRLDDNWQPVSYEGEIFPRYLSGAGFKNKNTILLFGGCGNPQGKQELGIINYYDLYSIDTQNFKTQKLWSIENENNDNYVVGNNIIVDEKNNKFYALCFPNDCSNSYILLKSFDLDNGNSTNYADTIPFTFNDVNSFCTLFYDSIQSQLYAVTNYNHENESDINIYSLAYPPLDIKDTLQEEADSSYLFYLFLILMGCGVLGGYFYFRKKKQPNKHLTKNVEKMTSPVLIPDETTPPTPRKKSSILFLDGFQVWDRDGKDITKSFTPILKQLIILIILYSESNHKGISNVTLRELLWFDKEDESAQNNRRVNIRKLKLLLEQLDGIELVKESTYWSIKFTQTYCDYVEVCKFINQIKNGHSITAQEIHNFPLNLLAGQLLPYVQTDWLDRFKSDYSNSILDISIKLSNQEFIRKNNELLIQIANIMFAHDKTDEYALILKCQALYKNGRTGLAKAAFDAFCNEYKTILNTDYTKTFNEVISGQQEK